MQETLDTIIDEQQLEAIKKRKDYTLSTIWDITDVSNKLNKNPSEISLELILSFLLCIILNMEINSFTWYTNVESKIKINGLLSDPLTIMRVHQGCLLSMLI